MNNIILKSITRILFPFIIIYGTYVVFHGHLSPGGGFAGGTIIGAGFVLRALAFEKGEKMEILPYGIIKRAESMSMLWFVLLGMVGILISRSFLTNTHPNISISKPGYLLSGGLILLLNLGIGVKVAATIISVFSSLEERG